MSKSNFRILLAGFVFAANAKVSKLLKSDKASDAELAAAVKTTKAYKDSEPLKAAVATVLATAMSVPTPEPAKSTTTRSGEPAYRR